MDKLKLAKTGEIFNEVYAVYKPKISAALSKRDNPKMLQVGFRHVRLDISENLVSRNVKTISAGF